MTDASHDSPPARAEAVLARVTDLDVPVLVGEYDGPHGPALDALCDELGSVAEELRPLAGQEGLLARVEARLGLLTATRYALGQRDADRCRARELLDRARVSEHLDAAGRAAARRGLVRMLGSRMARVQEHVRASGMADAKALRLADLQWATELGRPAEHGGSGMLEDTELLARLLREEPGGSLPPELGELLDGLTHGIDALRRGDTSAVLAFAERLLRSGRLPQPGGGAPPMLPRLLDSVVPALKSAFPGGELPRGPQPTGPDDAGLTPLWELMALAEAMNPGTLDEADAPALIAALTGSDPDAAQDPATLSSRMIAALTYLSQGTRTGDMEAMGDALRLMQEAFAAGEIDAAKRTDWLLPVVGGVLLAGSMTGGSLQDEELADAVLRDLDRAAPSTDDPDAITMHCCARIARLQITLQQALDAKDVEGVESVLLDLHDLDAVADDGLEWLSVLLSYTLGTASLGLASLTRTVEDVRAAAHHYEQVLDAAVTPPALQNLMDASWAPLLALIATVEKDPGRIAAGIERARSVLGRPSVTFDFEARVHSGLAIALRSLYDLTGDVAALEEAVAEIEQARAAMAPDSPGETSVHVMLAERLADRADARPGTPAAVADLRAAVAAARDALRSAADDVLLQVGVRHGLRMARQGADLGRAAALWALRTGDAEEAVGCLEAGRSLVLRAAAVSASVADRLEALGAGDLAARWRAAPAGGLAALPGAEDGSPLDALLSNAADGGPVLSGEVRRRSLALLRGRERPAGEPAAGTVAALRAGLSRSGADVLVHLLPGSGTQDGALLLITPEGPVRVVPSPGLSVGGRSPVTAFLAAGAARQRLEAPGVEASHQEWNRAERAWSASLDDLCAWAGEVLTPVLDGLDLWPRALCESGLARCPAHPRPSPGVPDTDTATATATATRADSPGENAGSGTPETAPVPKPTPTAAGTEGAMLADDARGPAAVGDASVTASGTHRAGDAGDAPGAAGVVGGAGLVGEGGAGHACAAVRLVLVPGGELGVVPWQAALVRPPERYGAPPAVRLCEVAVVSHAASGGEFLRAAARRRMPPGEHPVLVFHGDDLPWAEEEVEILGEVHYPGATVLSEGEDEHGSAAPTPERVLAVLGEADGAPASLVHLACHGLAGPDPTASALRLAPREPEAADGADGADLTLSALLDTRADGTADRRSGPLVVCSACETDLTTRDHDEALTVTSVLVHRLAADAIGSRWRVPDGASELLMLALHDALAAGLAPPDALRAAQRWMLAPPGRRPTPPGLRSVAGHRLRQDFRDRPEAWAAFVHQGNPAPAAPAPAAPREGTR
ncbi:CHAT domain-containing protein [Streptomyces rochei]|uniref:CHAT domain-containing protein n=1 Tax=Streptomyces TaxID=1883 RepID=UPI000A3841C2|nr:MULTISPECIES: CHAT domain-containing protein [Streptomyces]MDI3098382.1 CHAT domain-containing protein [Streptomyces sp. AN-3]WDI21285.1 CHAT domain-containing protein [Streptomyces enissocaesilis]